MRSDLRLLAIAGPPVLKLRDIVEMSRRAADGGVTAVQLRIKDVPAATLLEIATQLRAALTIPVWVNDRADVALAAGACGVHVGTGDIPPAAVRAFAGDRLQVGVSVGDEAEAAAARAAAADYWSIGALYATGTKPDAGTPIGPARFRALAALAPEGMTTIAIGGIGVENVAEVLAAGAHGVAVSQAVFAAGDVRRAAQSLRDVIDAHGPG
jgi:thiamine-phosphate pyrophosphorylase